MQIFFIQEKIKADGFCFLMQEQLIEIKCENYPQESLQNGLKSVEKIF
jgi:hypothetical protein